MSINDNIVYVPMAADILHHGHINIINEAHKYGKVIVGLLTDKVLESYKRIPIITYKNREIIIRSLRYVHDILKQDTLNYTEILEKLKPKYVVHGDDWKTGVQKPRRDEIIKCLKKWNGKLIEVKYTANISSTMIINKIIDNHIIRGNYVNKSKKLRKIIK